MGTAKITYTPAPKKSIVCTGSDYLSLADDNTLDMSTGDFSLDALIWPYAGTEGVIVAKGATDLASVSGWRLVMDVTWTRIIFQLNDGNVTKFSMVTDVGSITLSEWVWIRVEVDRDGNAVIYKNGVAIKTTAVSAYPGSLSNAEGLRVGSADWDGAIGLVRIDKGRILGATWVLEEWTRIAAGHGHKALDFTEVWDFADTLIGKSTTLRTLVHTGTAVYSDGYPAATAVLTINFERNPKYGYNFGFVESREIVRALDGTGYLTKATEKQLISFFLPAISFSQISALQAAHASGLPFLFYLDSALPPLGSFLGSGEQDISIIGPGFYSFDWTIEEI